MKIRGISMINDLALAASQDIKTETRRLCHDNGENLVGYKYVSDATTWPEAWKGLRSQPYTGWVAEFDNLAIAMPRSCPYGEEGDILYVKEQHVMYGRWKRNGITRTGRPRWKFVQDKSFQEVRYMDGLPDKVEKNSFKGTGWFKRLARYMPRKAARTWLQITEVTAQRLHAITEADAKAEGAPCGILINQPHWKHGGEYYLSANGHGTFRDGFKFLWLEINGRESWEGNPWVWVIRFKQIAAPEQTN